MSNSVEKRKKQEKKFDQFYTGDLVAEKCLEDLLYILRNNDTGNSLANITFLEPSAGGGAFLRALDKAGIHSYFACDIDPHHNNVIKCDFLNSDISNNIPEKDHVVVIGNPPFGRRARLAAAFINRALEYSGIVAFILPLQFQRYSAQNKIVESARLVFDRPLPPDSFVFNNKPYAVRCCFQIWTTLSFCEDSRLRTPPIVKHADFEMWQYNNTKEAEKYFNKNKYGWDFAIPRQGYKDYSLRETDPNKMDHHTQWIFFKAKSPEILSRLDQIDYDKLSKKNISIPGFGKADVIKEYATLFGDQPLDSSFSNESLSLESSITNNKNIGISTPEKGEDFGELPLGALLRC